MVYGVEYKIKEIHRLSQNVGMKSNKFRRIS